MSKDRGKFFLGAILGAVAGAAAGLLLAPKTGKETRKLIQKKAADYSKMGKDALKKEGEVLKKSIDELKNK